MDHPRWLRGLSNRAARYSSRPRLRRGNGLIIEALEDRKLLSTLRGDYDGDGRTDLSLFRPGTGEWFISTSGRGYRPDQQAVTFDRYVFGQAGDVAVAGTDFDGDGRTDLTLFRPGTGQWFVATSSSGFSTDP